jgi:Ca-activated chloride channel family protein
VRYKEPESETSRLLHRTAVDDAAGLGSATPDFKFSAAVAGFGMILRDSEFRGEATLADVLELARQGQGIDGDGARARFLELVGLAGGLGLE